MTPVVRDWLILGILVALVAVAGWALWRYTRDQRARAENAAAAARTEAEIENDTADVLAEKRARTEDERWREHVKIYRP